MRHMIGAAVLLASVASAAAQEPTGRDALFLTIGRAMAISMACERLSLNPNAIGFALKLVDVSPDDIRESGRYFPQIRKHAADTEAEIDAMGGADICAIGDYAFGAEGQDAPGFLVSSD